MYLLYLHHIQCTICTLICLFTVCISLTTSFILLFSLSLTQPIFSTNPFHTHNGLSKGLAKQLLYFPHRYVNKRRLLPSCSKVIPAQHIRMGKRESQALRMNGNIQWEFYAIYLYIRNFNRIDEKLIFFFAVDCGRIKIL